MNSLPLAHAGDLGDLIYGLCAVRAVGGGEVRLFRCNHRHTAFPMTRQRASLIEPLLLEQPYISGVWYSESPIESPLNEFRRPGFWQRTIADSHLATMGMPFTERDRPWIHVDRKVSEYPVLFHRSARYHNPFFPWNRILEQYGQHAVFVGLPHEHQAFCKRFGPISYVPTANLLELARMIAGSRLFVGNQSAPFAIAEALKANAILEVCPKYDNCSYPRANVIHGRDAAISLPSLSDIPVQMKESLAIVGP